MKAELIQSKKPTQWVVIHVNQCEYSNGPTCALVFLEQAFITRVQQIQAVIKQHHDLMGDYGAHIQTNSYPGGCVTFIQEAVAEKTIRPPFDGYQQDYQYVKSPSSKLLAHLKDIENDTEYDKNRVDYCSLRVYKCGFCFAGYLKWGEGNDSIFDTAEVGNQAWLPQKGLPV